jgi:putative ABC transport system substrate-binding protein
VKLLPDIVEEIKQQKPDLVYTQSTEVTKGIAGELAEQNPEKFVRDIPVVFSMVGDPVGAKLVLDLKKPERNLTGAIHVISMSIQMNSMKQYLPIKRLGIVYVKSEATQRKTYDQLKKLTDADGIELVAADPIGTDGAPQVERIIPMLDRMAAFKPDVVYVPNANFFGTNSKLLMAEALKRKLPTFCALETQIESGGLMGSVAKLINVGALAGYKAEQILLGKSTAHKIPIEVLAKFSFIVNIETARALSLYPPMQVLRFAQIV